MADTSNNVMLLRERQVSQRLCTKNFLLGMMISSLFSMAHVISRRQNPEQACRYQGSRGPLGSPGWGPHFPFPQAARPGQAAPRKAVLSPSSQRAEQGPAPLPQPLRKEGGAASAGAWYPTAGSAASARPIPTSPGSHLGPGRLEALHRRGLRLQLLGGRRRLLVPVAQVFLRAGADPGRGPEQLKQQEHEQPSRRRPAAPPGRGRHPARPAGTALRQEEVQAKGSVEPGVPAGASVRPGCRSGGSPAARGTRGPDRDGPAAGAPEQLGSRSHTLLQLPPQPNSSGPPPGQHDLPLARRQPGVVTFPAG